MANKKKKSDNFLNAVKKLSEKQRDVEYGNIVNIKKEAIEKAEKECSNKEQKYITREVSVAASKIKSKYAVKDLEAKGELFKLRDEMVTSVFNKAIEKLISFTKTAEYKKMLIRLAKEISEAVKDNECLLRVKVDDLKYSQDILRLFDDSAKIEQDDTILIGGIKCFCKNENIVADNTFDSKLADEKQKFTERAVLKILC